MIKKYFRENFFRGKFLRHHFSEKRPTDFSQKFGSVTTHIGSKPHRNVSISLMFSNKKIIFLKNHIRKVGK